MNLKENMDREVDVDERTPLVHDEIEKEEDLETENDEKLSHQRQFVLVSASFLLCFFIYGFGLSLSVLYPVFADVFNSNRTTAALIQSLYSSIGMAFSILWNKPVLRFGSGLCIGFGVCLVVLGIFLAQFATNIWILIFLISIVGGMGVSIIGVGPHLIINRKVTKHKMAALALIPASGSLGQFCFVILTEFFIETYGWSGALLLMSAIQANMFPFAILIARIDAQSSRKKTIPVKPDKMFTTELFKNWRLYILFVNCFFFLFSAFLETKFIVDYAIDKGLGREIGSQLASYCGIAGFVGRTACFGLKMIVPGKSLLQSSALSLIIAASHAIIVYSESYTYILLGTLLNGFALGMLVSLFSNVLLEIFSPGHFGSAFTITFVVNGVGSFLGGYIGGFIRDTYGNYNLLFNLSIGFGVLMTLLYLTLVISVSNIWRKMFK
ncbi:Mct1p [Mactra antiquata]